MRSVIPAFCICCTLLLPATSMAADTQKGKALHEANCQSCHDSSVYTRKERRVTTTEGIKKQVRRCEQSLGLKWFDEQIDDVTAYLNDTYYQYK